MSDLLDRKCTIEKCWICAKCCLYYPPNDKRDFVLAKPNLIKWRLNNNHLLKSASDKALMLDILKRYSTGEIVESGEQKEKEYMDNREILKELDEAIKLNREARSKNNDAMCHAKNALMYGENCKIEDSVAYKHGLEDAWEIARKVLLGPSNGGYTPREHVEIFKMSYIDVMRDLTIHEVKEKIAAYEAEQAKPKLGDVVEIDDRGEFLFLGEGREYYYALDPSDNDGIPHQFVKKYVEKIEKTGKHFDIQSMLDEIG